MNMVPSYGNTGEQTTATLIDAMMKRGHMMQQSNAGKYDSLMTAQTADLGRAADGRTTMLQNIDKIAEVLGYGPAMDILTRQYDPARPMDASTPNMQAAAQYGPRADELRLFESFGRGTKDVGTGVGNLVARAGQMPDMSLISQYRLDNFTDVPRDAQFGGGGRGDGRFPGGNPSFTNQRHAPIDPTTGNILTVGGRELYFKNQEEAMNWAAQNYDKTFDNGVPISSILDGATVIIPAGEFSNKNDLVPTGAGLPGANPINPNGTDPFSTRLF